MSATIHTPARRGRILGAVRLAWAATLVAAPHRIIAFAGGRPSPTAVAIARVLAARHALQGIVEVTTWPRWRKPGMAVDGAHALSALALAGLDTRWRHIAFCDAAVAGGFGLAGRANG